MNGQGKSKFFLCNVTAHIIMEKVAAHSGQHTMYKQNMFRRYVFVVCNEQSQKVRNVRVVSINATYLLFLLKKLIKKCGKYEKCSHLQTPQ